MERTVVLLKPDCVQKKIMGEVIKRFEGEGFRVVGCKMAQLDESTLRAHYAHLTELPFFPEILGFMQSSPILALSLEGESVIMKVRELIGPTDSAKAEKVIVLEVDAENHNGPNTLEVVKYLEWHGIKAESHNLDRVGTDSDSLLAATSAVSADMLVMGAYTRSRLRRLVFGGVTRDVLTRSIVPVLMAH